MCIIELFDYSSNLIFPNDMFMTTKYLYEISRDKMLKQMAQKYELFNL